MEESKENTPYTRISIRPQSARTKGIDSEFYIQIGIDSFCILAASKASRRFSFNTKKKSVLCFIRLAKNLKEYLKVQPSSYREEKNPEIIHVFRMGAWTISYVSCA